MQNGDLKAAAYGHPAFDIYFFRFISFIATATTPPIASSGKTPGSGTVTLPAQADIGIHSSSDKIMNAYFISFPPDLYRTLAFRVCTIVTSF
jgi:hypothetical protein